MKLIFATLTCVLVCNFGLGQEPTFSRDRRGNALSWVRQSAEYHVAAKQAYRLARLQLDAGLANRSFSADDVQAGAEGIDALPPAVILDVDETVLDNSEYNVRRVRAGGEYGSESWSKWCEERAAPAVPGALEFLKYAQSKGVAVFFVTNRRDKQRQATFDNLLKVGVTTKLENVRTRNDDAGRGGDKVSRRADVAASHRIVLLIGDNFADLTAGDRDEFRNDANAGMSDGWVLLPNPVYGSWDPGPSTAPANQSSPQLAQPITNWNAPSSHMVFPMAPVHYSIPTNAVIWIVPPATWGCHCPPW